MFIQRNKFRRDTIEGRRAAERALLAARREAAALTIQRYARRLMAQRRVQTLPKPELLESII